MLHLLKDEGITIVASTPYMDEARQCDRIALIDNGEILSIDTPEHVAKSFPKSLYGIKAENTYSLLKALQEYPQAHSVQPFGEFIHYTENGESANLESLRSYLEGKGLNEVEIKQLEPGIEDMFMELMKEPEHV